MTDGWGSGAIGSDLTQDWRLGGRVWKHMKKKKRPATSPSRTLMSLNFLCESYTQQLGSGRGGDNGEDSDRTGSSEMTIRLSEFD